MTVDAYRLMPYQKVGTVPASISPCREPEWIVENNFPLGFDAMMQLLADSLASTAVGNDAEGVLLLADFSFALLSSEFLYRLNSEGSVPKDGDPQWDQASLRACYDLANANGIALNCAHRTSFFLKLLDTLMARPYFTVSVPGKHHYPVVMVDERDDFWMVTDPYDPFVVLDEEQRVMDIFTAIESRKGQVFRTSRAFGPTRLLVSDSLLSHLPKERQQWCEAVALWDSVVTAQLGSETDIRDKLSFDLGSPYSLSGENGYSYTVPDLGRPDTFDFKTFFHPLRSHYVKSDAVAVVPGPMTDNEVVIRAVNRFNRAMSHRTDSIP